MAGERLPLSQEDMMREMQAAFSYLLTRYHAGTLMLTDDELGFHGAIRVVKEEDKTTFTIIDGRSFN